jgi:hypothetical protein
MIHRPRFDLGAFRKCIHAMSDRELAGIGSTCLALSKNAFTRQFAECKREWNLRYPPRRRRVHRHINQQLKHSMSGGGVQF